MTGEISVEVVDALTRTAELPLASEGKAAIVQTLEAWLPDANRLSAMMSRDEYREFMPITAFSHLDVGNAAG